MWQVVSHGQTEGHKSIQQVFSEKAFWAILKYDLDDEGLTCVAVIMATQLYFDCSAAYMYTQLIKQVQNWRSYSTCSCTANTHHGVNLVPRPHPCGLESRGVGHGDKTTTECEANKMATSKHYVGVIRYTHSWRPRRWYEMHMCYQTDTQSVDHKHECRWCCGHWNMPSYSHHLLQEVPPTHPPGWCDFPPCLGTLVGSIGHIEVSSACPPSNMATALPSHVTVDLHSSSIGIPDPVVPRRAAWREFAAGGCRISLGLECFTGDDSIAQKVLNILSYLNSFNH